MMASQLCQTVLPDVTVDTQPGAVFDSSYFGDLGGGNDDNDVRDAREYSISQGFSGGNMGLGSRSFDQTQSFGVGSGGSRGFGSGSMGLNKGALVKKRKGLASR